MIEAHDLELLADFWLHEYPAMDERPRSSILAGVQNTLHTFNTGIARELVSTTTSCSPATMERGKWILVDMPLDQYGASGKFVMTGWKFLTQKHILRRKPGLEDSPIVIWCDEAQEVLNSHDASFLAKCRSHFGCMVYLTQSIHSYYGAMGSHQAEHQANALLTNFLHKVFHVVGDAQTAQWASSLLGERREIMGGGSLSPAPEPFDILMGRARFSGSFSEQYRPVLQNNAFMRGMRTGGARHHMIVDGIVIRSGEPFSTGENWLWVSFGQE